MNASLADLFKRKQQQAAGDVKIDWDERRNNYQKAVDDLYGQIKSILAEPIAQKSVSMHRRSKTLTENYIGTYTIDDLILLIGSEQVRFSPLGRNIVGASGRVDVLGERGEATLVVQTDGRWSVVQSRQPTLKLTPFDETSLAEVLKIVTRD